MRKTDNVIAIPAYKAQLEDIEKHSLRQCLSILGKHDIRLVCPPELDLTAYQELFAEYDKELITEFFNAVFFRNINGYNSLLLSKDYYNRFGEWNYMLIYQPDAYVFNDDLDYWCSLDYDYIGAPWCLFRSTELDMNNSGNGGLSLRKITSMLGALSYKGILLNYQGLKYMYTERGPYMTPVLLATGATIGFQNSVKAIIEKDLANEDKFFAMQKYRRRKPLKVAPTNVAMYFSFEQVPSKLFELTNGKLPFGCHAWERYEYESFWKEHIKFVGEIPIR